MVKLLNTDQVTKEQLKKQLKEQLKKQEQLAIVVDTNNGLEELVKNINEIIKEENINLNKKVIFILPKDNLDEWKKNDFPLYFGNNNYFGLYYADVDELNEKEKLEKKLNKKVYTDRAFENSATHDIIRNKEAGDGDIDEVIERVKLYTDFNRKKFSSTNNTGIVTFKLKDETENPYKELTKDNFQFVAKHLGIELSRKLSIQKKDEDLISLAKKLAKKSDKTSDKTLGEASEAVNILIEQRGHINHLKDYHDKRIKKLKYTIEEPEYTIPSDFAFKPSVATWFMLNPKAATKKTKPLIKTLEAKERDEFLKLEGQYMGLNIDCSYEFKEGELIFTVNKVNEHGLGHYAGFKDEDKITYKGLPYNAQTSVIDETFVNIVNELRKGNLVGGEVSRVEGGNVIKTTTEDFQGKIDDVRFNDEASTPGSTAYKILIANGPITQTPPPIIKKLDRRHSTLIEALVKAEERAEEAAARETAQAEAETRATAAARAAQAEAETRAEAAETSLAEEKKAGEEARAAKAEAEQRLAEAAREAQAEAAREAAEEKAAREEAAEEKAARLAAEAATAAEVARAAREAQAEAARAAQAEAEQRLAEEATAAEAARKAEEEKAEAAVARETAEAAARAAAERLVEVEAELAGVREELQKVLTEAEAAKKAAEEKAVREGAAREGAVREAAEEARAAREAEAAREAAAREVVGVRAELAGVRKELQKVLTEVTRLAAKVVAREEALTEATRLAAAAEERETALTQEAVARETALTEAAEEARAARAAKAAAEAKAAALDNLTIEMERYQEGLRNDVKNIDKLLKLASQQKQAIVSMSATSTQEHRVKVAKVGIKVVVDYVIKLIIMDKEDNLNGETYSETSRKLDKLTLEHYMDSCFIGNAMGNVTQEYNSICNFIKGKKDIHEIVNKDIDDNLCKRLEENPKRTVEILLKASKDYNEAMKEAVKKYTQDVVNQFKTGARRIQHQVETKTTFLSEINGSGPEPSSSPGSASARTTTPVPVNRLR